MTMMMKAQRRCLSLLLLAVCCLQSVAEAQVKVAAYYYPWYAGDFHYEEGYLRQEIGQSPALGEYDDRYSQVIEQHLAWSAHANIQVWITSWWGPGSREDETLQNYIMPVLSDGKTHEFAIFYETRDRIGAHNETSTGFVLEDMDYICDTLFSHPNYYRIDGRPVIFIYLTRSLQNDFTLSETLLLFRSAAGKRGYNIYLVGDHAHGPPPVAPVPAFDTLDAITNYDVYGAAAIGSSSPYIGSTKLAEYYEKQKDWARMAWHQNCAYIPSVTPGFNDRGVRPEANRQPLSRKLNDKESEFGSLFQTSIRHAFDLVSPKADHMIVVNSFNEWHEDTQIEPNMAVEYQVDISASQDYTLGLEYEVYGERYLQILKKMTMPLGFRGSLSNLKLCTKRKPLFQYDGPSVIPPECRRFTPILVTP